MEKKKRLRITYFLIAVIVIAVAGIIFTLKMNPTLESNRTKANTTGLISGKVIEGNPNASVTIVEFSDYECPYCQRFYQTTYQEIKQKYIDTGKVNLVFKNFPLSIHKNAEKAAEAAECAGEQGKYYEMYDELFTKGVEGGTTEFKAYAKDIGLNQVEFNGCLDSGKMKSKINEDIKEGKVLGVTGTPTFFIGKQMIVGAQHFSIFEQKIEEELNKN